MNATARRAAFSAALLLGPLWARAQTAGLDLGLHGAAGIVLRAQALRRDAAASPAPALYFHIPEGMLSVENAWVNDPFTGEDALKGRIGFLPGPACPACRSIRMLQVARVETAPGRDLDWTSGEENRNLMRTAADPAAGVQPGFFVDHDALRCGPGKPCSPYYRDSWPLPDESGDGSNSGGRAVPASLADYPHGWTSFERITLEACAVCDDTGAFLGCVSWGGTWPETGDRSIMTPRPAAGPSPTFLAAVARFRSFYSAPGAGS